MTRLTFTEAGHIYKLDGRRVSSVTTILQVLAKPALVNWAANAAADYAIDHWDSLASMPPSERRSAISRAPNKSRNKAAAKGTQIHDWADKLTAGREVEIPEAYVETVERFARWWEGSKFEPAAAEAAVFSDFDEVYGTAYAARFDMLATHPSYGLTLIDWKTSNGVYPEHGLQLAAYRDAVMLQDGDTGVPMPSIDTAAVAHVRESGVVLHILDAAQAKAAQDKWELVRAIHTLPDPQFTETAEGVA